MQLYLLYSHIFLALDMEKTFLPTIIYLYLVKATFDSARKVSHTILEITEKKGRFMFLNLTMLDRTTA